MNILPFGEHDWSWILTRIYLKIATGFLRFKKSFEQRRQKIITCVSHTKKYRYCNLCVLFDGFDIVCPSNDWPNQDVEYYHLKFCHASF